MSKNKNRRREETIPTVVSVTEKIPLVSVIIPMFNAAKFIPQTLESLLYQTMTDFEVVVVDDCSIDNSIEVVESFSERFGGRLKLVKLAKNTGTPGLPRNVGIQCARGKYIAFLDSDDLFTKTALEELSILAEKFQADVVHMNDTFKLFGAMACSVDDPRVTDMKELLNPKNLKLAEWRWPVLPRPKPLDIPTLMPDDLEKRLKIWLDWQYRWAMCTTFCRRDFLLINQIYFSNISTGEDVPFGFECMCTAKNCLQIPNVVYIIRPIFGSASRENFNADFRKQFCNKVSAFKKVFNEFERVMDKIKFFRSHLKYRYDVLDFFANIKPLLSSINIQKLYAQIPTFKLNSLVKENFHSDDAALVAYLFNTVNVYRLQIMKLQQEITVLKNSKQQEVSDVQK